MKLTITTECGEKTCAVEKGKFCRWMYANWQGQARCGLYDEQLFDVDGWTQRGSTCLREHPAAREEGR